MTAAWVRARSELRRRRRAWVLLAIVAGVVAGAGVAAAAGARRTETAYPRFYEQYHGSDVILGGVSGESLAEVEDKRRRITALPQVAAHAESQFISDSIRVLPGGAAIAFPEVFVVGDRTGRESVRINRVKMLEGRMFRRDAPAEAITDFNVARRFGWRVGQRLQVMLFDPSAGFPPTEGIPKEVRLVGIGVVPGAMPAVGSVALSGILVSPGFMHANSELIPPNEDAPTVRLKPGVDLLEFIRDARAIAPNLDVPTNRELHLAGVRKTLRFEVLALWILAALIGLAFLVIIGQAIARQAMSETDDYGVLRALGMSRGELFLVGLLRAAFVAVVAAFVATATAVLASPLTPIGLSAVVEPDPGLYVDTAVLLIGAAVTAVSVMVVAAVPAWIGAVRKGRSFAASSRPSLVARLLARAGVGPVPVAGVRLALEAGRGARATPVRTAVLGTATALVAVVAAGTFATSLQRLVQDPRLYGFAWDVIAGNDDAVAAERILRADRDVEAFTRGGAANIRIGNKQLIPFIYADGGIAPTILEGDAPQQADEIALGGGLLDQLGKRIGDEVVVSRAENEEDSARSMTLRIVGRTVVPPFFFQQVEPGESAAMPLEAWYRIAPPDAAGGGSPETLPSVIRYRDGVDVRAKVEELRARLPGLFVLQLRQPGAELAGIGQVADTPLWLTHVLLIMAAATLTHALVMSVRRRRRDLAVLKTLGFRRAQVIGTVSWQASVLVLAALMLGIPLGIVAGRWAWIAFAEALGVVAAPDIPLMIVLAVIPPVALLAGNLVAALPARAAARTQPALVLRSP